MLLDTDVCRLYRVDAPRGGASPVDGLEPIYHNWYGKLRHESGGGETGDVTLRIRIHDANVRENDIAEADGQYWRISRVYHGSDDDNGQPIADLTLTGGERHFVQLAIMPRKVLSDALNTITGLPDTRQKRSVWGSTGAVNVDEYYAAEAAGHELSARIEIYAYDYRGEPYVQAGDDCYLVRRREYRGSMVNLICEAVTAWRE